MDPDRRELLRQIALLAAGLSACRRSREDTPDASSIAKSGLLPPQRETLQSACARILPGDRDPGAIEARVVDYFERELARPEMALIRTNVLAGIVALDRHAGRSGGKRFIALAALEQDEVLRQVQAGSERGADFLRILVVLTLEGFLGDPRWGGNANGIGWRFIGYGPGAHHE